MDAADYYLNIFVYIFVVFNIYKKYIKMSINLIKYIKFMQKKFDKKFM